MALTHLGVLIDDAGMPEEGLQTVREAVDIQRAAHDLDPDPNLAGMLHRLGVRYTRLGRPEEAV